LAKGFDVPLSEGDSASLVRAIAETSPAMLWMGDAEGKCMFLNKALRDFWGVNPVRLEDFDWTSTVHPDDVGVLSGPFAKAMITHTPFVVEARYRRADGAYRTMRTEANPRFADDGSFLGMTGVNTDITEQLAAEARSRMLMGELNHRTKNLLTVVQALARQTARGTEPERFVQALDQRLLSLGASNDLLLRNDWEGVWLDELVQAQLAFIPDSLGARVVTSGPRLRIASHGAQALGMALHELSTNSLKYGALSVPEGQVQLHWEVPEGGGWSVDWREHTPNPVEPPKHKGFGHRVIVDMVSSAFGASVELDFSAPGLHWRLTAPAA
jgi:PAS domain S-box-containing protein